MQFEYSFETVLIGNAKSCFKCRGILGRDPLSRLVFFTYLTPNDLKSTVSFQPCNDRYIFLEIIFVIYIWNWCWSYLVRCRYHSILNSRQSFTSCLGLKLSCHYNLPEHRSNNLLVSFRIEQIFCPVLRHHNRIYSFREWLRKPSGSWAALKCLFTLKVPGNQFKVSQSYVSPWYSCFHI